MDEALVAAIRILLSQQVLTDDLGREFVVTGFKDGFATALLSRIDVQSDHRMEVHVTMLSGFKKK